MPAPSAEEADLTPEVEQAIQQLLADQPGFPMPTAARARINAALAAEAATRTALIGNDAEPTAPGTALSKAVDPVRDHEEA